MAISLRQPVVALLSGSYRRGSLNAKLLESAGALLRARGAETRVLSITDYTLPLFDQAVEAAAFPEDAKKLKADIQAADAILVAKPTPALVNAITWATRGGGGMYDAFRGKVGAVIAASPGAMGGMCGLNPTRDLLQNCGVRCLSASVAVGRAFSAFGEDGKSLADSRQAARLEAAIDQLFHDARAEANREAQCEVMEEIKRLDGVGQYGEIDIVRARSPE